jgi:protein-S-isoprenylcysteine O-methyltransferase
MLDRGANFLYCAAMLIWITDILAFGYFGLELFLSIRRRGRAPMKADDRGTLPIFWILIGGSCSIAFTLSHTLPAFGLEQNVSIMLFADLLLITGMIIRIWAIVHLGRFFTVDVGIQNGHHVIDDGPYRYVRHPSYTGSLVALTGIACLTFNWLGFLLILVCSAAAFAVRIQSEEKTLRENLGQAYVEYSERTKRLIPGVF